MTDSEKWKNVETFFETHFSDGEKINLDSILFLIGVQELGKGKLKFKKDEKLNVIHIAVCKMLEPFGYYRFDGFHNEGWPQYELVEKLPNLQAHEQSILMKKAIINYFEAEKLLTF